MPTNVHHGSATIYDFASRVRAMRKDRHDAAHLHDAHLDAQAGRPVAVCSGAWYHEAAIQGPGQDKLDVPTPDIPTSGRRASEFDGSKILDFDRTRRH